MKARSYIAIDLKSFYASVECIQRGLDPMITNLVVADPSRTDKTICLAVSPSLKSFGIPGRPRLFEVVQKIGQVNALRRNSAPGRAFTGKSHDYTELRGHPELEVDYIVAPPQNGVLYGDQRGHLQYLSQIHRPGGHPPLLHRRGVHRRHKLPESLPPDSAKSSP